MKILSTILVVILLSGCAIPTVIKSKPEGATVYINEINMGKTPLTYSDKEILFSQKNVRLELAGYKSFSSIIKKDKLKVGPLVGACFVGVPALWMLGYEEEYTFQLERGHSTRVSEKSNPIKSTSEDLPKMTHEQPATKPIANKAEPSTAPQVSSASASSMFANQNNTKIRKSPSSKGTVVKTLKKGTEVQIVKQKEEWFLVELTGGETGWCHNSVLSQKN